MSMPALLPMSWPRAVRGNWPSGSLPMFVTLRLRLTVVRQRMRGALLECRPNLIANLILLSPQPRIPKPQDLDPARLQIRIAFTIFDSLRRRTVLEAVNLDID